MRPEAADILRTQWRTRQLRCEQVPARRHSLRAALLHRIKFVQSPALIVILLEVDGTHRQIYTDGRELPKEVAQPSWLGYSVGKWERDTLVVKNTAGSTTRPGSMTSATPIAKPCASVERYHRRDFGHMDVEMTIDDPQMYTKPFTIKSPKSFWPTLTSLSDVCNENEKDRAHVAQVGGEDDTSPAARPRRAPLGWSTASAQWLNYPTPGTPRTTDGKPNLTAPAPRALTASRTSPASGTRAHLARGNEAPVRRPGRCLNVPGMEIDTASKYGFDILLDFKPRKRRCGPKPRKFSAGARQATPRDDLPADRHPLRRFLSEPIKIVQSPRLIVVLYERRHTSPNLH